MLGGPADQQTVAVSFASLARDGNVPAAAQILTGDGFGTGTDIFKAAGRHDLSAVDARARADVHNIIRRAHGVLVMLHDDQGVAEIAQLLERSQQLFVVALVQADARLVQDIQNAHEA